MTRSALWVLAAVLLGACRDGNVMALYFSEEEPGGEPMTTRMLVTDSHLRIDYGADTDDYVLFDRKAPAIYSVNREDRTVLVITPLPVDLAPPEPFVHTVKKDPASYPAIAGQEVIHYSLLTNGTECYDLFAAEGLLPRAVRALREYHETIAGEHASAARHAPKEVRTDCDLANFIFLPARHLAHGFPVRQRDMNGKTRQLVDYRRDVPVDASVFTIPEDYRRYRTAEMRGSG